jgi:excisionase family DNA binding protein
MNTKTTAPAKELAPVFLALGVDDASRALGIGRTMLYHLVQSGRIRSITIGKRRLFRKADLEAFLAGEANHAA